MTADVVPRISVIVPAHNEAAVIQRTLAAVMASSIVDDIEVIVVCNGCTDDTAAIAQSVSPLIRVLHAPVAAKHAALNLGDREARGHHRAYLDADTVLSPGALEAVADLLDRDDVLAASPEVRFVTTHCSWPAAQFHRIWRQSPYYRTTTLGAGFYGVSAEGRRRFVEFPPVIGDDFFVSNLFAAHERRTAHGHTYAPLLPATLRSMLHVHIRHYGAHGEFDEWWAANGDGPLAGRADSSYGWLLPLLRAPANWPGVAIYVAVKVVSIPLGRRKHRRRGMARWNRDEGGRRAATQ
jgi:glycosyltransferase involved in cell wall biosynthesis